MSAVGWRQARARRWAALTRAEDEPALRWLRDATPELTRASAAMAGPAASGLALGPGLGLHHDGQADAVRLGLGAAPGEGLTLTLGDFAGTWLSVTADLPRETLPRSAVLALWVAFEPGWAAPVVRANLKCGVNLERPPVFVTRLEDGLLAEFDLSPLPPPDPAGGWCDVIFPAMPRQTLRVAALRLSLRHRAGG